MKQSDLILLVKDVLGSGAGEILLKEWYDNVKKIGFSSDPNEVIWNASKQNFIVHLMSQVAMSENELSNIIRQENEAAKAKNLNHSIIDGDLFNE